MSILHNVFINERSATYLISMSLTKTLLRWCRTETKNWPQTTAIIQLKSNFIITQSIFSVRVIQNSPQLTHESEDWSVLYSYRKTSNIRCTLVGNKIVDHSDVVGASPVGAAPTTSSFSTEHLASRDSAKTAARQYPNLLSAEIWCVLH